jgi:hypothetical protein
MAVAGALVIVVIAIVVTTITIMRGQMRPVETAQPAAPGAASAPATTRSADDLGWLMTAMDECEAQASKEAGTLQFLVIPLASASNDRAQWRAKSLNDIGNGILLSSQDALDALKISALTISTEQYVFRVKDESTNATYQWKPSVGVAKLSTAEADAIRSFKVQFQTGDKPRDGEWGNAFTRQKGTCYWVNAIVGN